jgi:hypothetical protein
LLVPPTPKRLFYPVRSERMLMVQTRYNLLFRWFVGLAIEDAVWDHPVFSKNRDRLLEHEVVEAFFTEVMSRADTHFTRDHHRANPSGKSPALSHTSKGSVFPKNVGFIRRAKRSSAKCLQTCSELRSKRRVFRVQGP